MNKSLLMLSIVPFLLVFTSNSQAEIYKWVDANGITHYSAHPPVKKKIRAKAKNIEDKIRSAAGKYKPVKGSKKTNSRENHSANNTNQKEKNHGDNELSPPDKKLVDYCKNQRRNLEGLKSNFRNVWVDKNGKKTLLDQQQRQEKVNILAKNIKETCAEVN